MIGKTRVEMPQSLKQVLLIIAITSIQLISTCECLCQKVSVGVSLGPPSKSQYYYGLSNREQQWESFHSEAFVSRIFNEGFRGLVGLGFSKNRIEYVSWNYVNVIDSKSLKFNLESQFLNLFDEAKTINLRFLLGCRVPIISSYTVELREGTPNRIQSFKGFQVYDIYVGVSLSRLLSAKCRIELLPVVLNSSLGRIKVKSGDSASDISTILFDWCSFRLSYIL
ncbi:MAG: hypothetical protein RL092_1190 [Bacteroidota bacterium]